MSSLPSPFKSKRGETEYMAAYEASMRLWPVPYEDRFIPSRFGSTHLTVCGPKDAPPLVLLHCFNTSLTTWAYNIADFSNEYRVYALDMMGQPSKSIPDQRIRTREEMAEWLTEVLDGLDVKQTDLIGYSFGGFAALNYAMRAPERVKRPVLLAPAGGLIPLWKQFYIRGILSTIIPSNGLTAKILWFNWFFYGPNLRNVKTRRIFDLLVKQFALGVRYFRMGAGVLPLAFKSEELQSISTPTMLLIGKEEALYDPVAAVARAKNLIPNIRVELIPDVSHDLPVSKPEIVDKLALEFLKAR